MDFEFRSLKVYQEAKAFHAQIQEILKTEKPNRILSDQLNRASLSIVLNIAEGYGRFHKADKRNFYVNARGSLNEVMACLDILFNSQISEDLLNKAIEDTLAPHNLLFSRIRPLYFNGTISLTP